MYYCVYLVMIRVIWNGNGVVWSEHGTVRNLVKRNEMGAPHGQDSLHLLPHHLVHSRQSPVLRAVVTTPLATQPY